MRYTQTLNNACHKKNSSVAASHKNLTPYIIVLGFFSTLRLGFSTGEILYSFVLWGHMKGQQQVHCKFQLLLYSAVSSIENKNK